MSHVAIAITTISENRMVYAEGSRSPRYGSTSSFVVGSDMGLSFVGGRNRDGLGLVCPVCTRPGHLEPDESIEDVEQRAEQVEEAEREVRRGRDAEHS